MSRHGKRKKNKRNHLRDFKTRALCPECSSGKVTLLNKQRHIFKCLACEHKFIFDNGTYDVLVTRTEQEVEEIKVIQEDTSDYVTKGDALDDFFDNLAI